MTQKGASQIEQVQYILNCQTSSISCAINKYSNTQCSITVLNFDQKSVQFFLVSKGD